MAFLGYLIQYMLKINLGIGIVCMVNNTAVFQLQQQQTQLVQLNNRESRLFLYSNVSNNRIVESMNETSSNDVCSYQLAHGKSLVS